MRNFIEPQPNQTLSEVDVKESQYVVTKKSVNIHNGPGYHYNILSSIGIGENVNVIGNEVNGWYPISYNNEIAYINGMFLVKHFIIDRENREKPEKIVLDVPYIKQRPALPSGCEATSLTMALHYYGFAVTKEEIAENHIFDYTPLTRNKDESIAIWGNPQTGYVGDPFSLGYTIYPNQLKKQANQYVPSKNTTGASLETLEYFIAEGKPVLVWITN